MSKPPRITRVPTCTTKGCPFPKSPEWHIPWCGHGTEGHHHHVPKRSQGGKDIVAFLCPDCHNRVDNTPNWDNAVTPGEDGSLEYTLWDTRVEEGWNHPLICRTLEAGSAAAERVEASGGQADSPVGSGAAVQLGGPSVSDKAPLAAAPPVSGGAGEAEKRGRGTALSAPISESSPALSVLTEDWSQVSDDDLEVKFRTADQMQGMAFLIKCKVVQAYRENHVQAWGRSWTEQAIERFGQSRRTCEAYANIWQICATSDAFSTEDIGPLTDSRGLMQYIGRQDPEAGAVAMQAAVAHLAEYGEPPTVAALAGEGKPRVQRWTLEEFRYLAREWGRTKGLLPDDIFTFCDWLEAQ